ncbi:hypothetical protein BCR22_11670 [Enterococcus plantarum]|uniref:GNAT family N-acetyltransferase n=1 Tax=Enterococcus plantarum TaxID=1077675 RepID=UPI00084D3BA9|nr:GNAT family N-acetyltransferase [Enterococcus plantarum]OEG18023.1 hypothetical protein BCR22_11670 [Enterococcus plantarum]
MNKRKLKQAYLDMQDSLSQIDTLSDKLREIQQENKQLIKQNESLLKIEIFNDSLTQIFKVIPYKKEQWVVTVTKEVDWARHGQIDKMRFELFNLNNPRTPNYRYSEIWVRMIYHNNAEYLERIIIIDCTTHYEHINKGYGSILMKEFLHYVKLLNRKELEITGTLSPVDEQKKENHERRDHFYRKFGFKIEGRRLSLKLNKF